MTTTKTSQQPLRGLASDKEGEAPSPKSTKPSQSRRNAKQPTQTSLTHFRANVHVRLKRTINDPQGLTICDALHSLGYEMVNQVRAGKIVEVWLFATDRDTAHDLATQMSKRCLVNPVIEEFDILDITDDAW